MTPFIKNEIAYVSQRQGYLLHMIFEEIDHLKTIHWDLLTTEPAIRELDKLVKADILRKEISESGDIRWIPLVDQYTVDK